MSTEQQRPIKTLLVEDDADLAELAVELLEATGCEVTAASTPEEAVSIMQASDDFELLFTDYRFPSHLTGLDLADKAADTVPDIKVIVATGFDQQTIDSAGQGKYHVLQKPYWLDDIKALVKKLFPRLKPTSTFS